MAKGTEPPLQIDPFGITAVKMKLNAQADASKGASILTGEVDYFTFVVPVTQEYTISALTPSMKVDTVMRVYAFDGSRLAQNDDSAVPLPSGATDSQVKLVLTAGERVYISVTNTFTSVRGAYKVTVNRARGDDVLELAGYHSFVAPMTQMYTILATTPTSTVNTLLSAFAANGTFLGQNDDRAPGDTDSEVQVALTAGQRIYVSVGSAPGSKLGRYQLKVTGANAAVVLDTPGTILSGVNDSRAKATDLGALVARSRSMSWSWPMAQIGTSSPLTRTTARTTRSASTTT